MMNNRKMASIKRIAFAGSNHHNRKSLIEWSYYNQEILKNHELIAAGAMAGLLEGTLGVPVTRLAEDASAANQQLASLIAEQKIDILLFFWDPVQPLQHEDGARYLQELAIINNIITAGNLATADFVLSSVRMDKTHSVPVFTDWQDTGKPTGYCNAREGRRVTLKVNTIN